MNLKTAANEPQTSTLVKAGALQKAFDAYRAGHGRIKSMALWLRHALLYVSRRLVVRLAFPLIRSLLISKNWDSGYTAVDLSEAFVLFWKKSDLVGPLLLWQILKAALTQNVVPVRATVWLAHWLVFQGAYRDAAYLFRLVNAPTRAHSNLRSEWSSLLANYFYVRGKFAFAKKLFRETHRSTYKDENRFLNLFNLGLWVMVAANEGELRSLEQITSYFDSLDPEEPDERYGLRLLAVSAYLQIKFGNPDLGNRYWLSATRVMERSGSPLDRAIYLAFKSLINVLSGDLKGSLDALRTAELELQSFGRYKYYEDLFKALRLKFTDQAPTGADVATVFPHHRGIWRFLATDEGQQIVAAAPVLESWYRRYFEVVLPQLEASETIDREQLLALLKEQSMATVFEIETTPANASCVQVHQISLRQNGARFEFNFIHRGDVCLVRLMSPFLPWRNRDVFVALKAMIVSLQVSSFQDFERLRIVEQNAALEIAKLARQVAHDIRSPLSALSMLVACAKGLTDEQASLLKASAHRIHLIASDLLNQSRGVGTQGANDSKGEQISTLVLSTPASIEELVDAVIREKKIELSQQESADLHARHKNNLTPIPKSIEVHSLFVVLSNLINNAIEATSEKALVVIDTGIVDEQIEIVVRDNGSGISKENVALIKQGVAFSTKAEGNGIGLRHAQSELKRWRGDLTVNSQEGLGTTVRLTLPLSSTSLPTHDNPTSLLINQFP